MGSLCRSKQVSAARSTSEQAHIPLTHDQMHCASRVTCTTDPPLESVDDNFAILALNSKLDVGSIGRGDISFGHREGRADLAIQQRFKPLLLLFGGTISSEDLCKTAFKVNAMYTNVITLRAVDVPMLPVSLERERHVLSGEQHITDQRILTVQNNCKLLEQ